MELLRRLPLAGCLLLLGILQAFGQSNTGELRLRVTDPDGLGIVSAVELVSESNQFRHTFTTDESGNLVVKLVPFGLYELQVQREGFAAFSRVGGNTLRGSRGLPDNPRHRPS